jgi:hypothetical protein
MKLFFLFLLIFTTNLVAFSQSDSSDFYKMNALKEKKIAFHKLTNGEYDGYRIKIHFGQNRETALEIKSKFMSKYKDVGAYEEYQQPNFVILVGDFKTKPEAYGFLTKIKSDFSASFIVKDKIKPQHLK